MDVSKCTSCHHEVKGLVRIFPLCNGGMKLVVEDGPRNCPRCSILLTIDQYNHHDLDTCPSLRELDKRVFDLECMGKIINRFNARHWLYKYLR